MGMAWHLTLMAVGYILAGINHFVMPRFYVRMIPRYLPARRALNILSGIAEIVLGAMLFFPETRSMAAILIIAMLAVFLLVHVNMVQDRNVVPFAPGWALWARLFFQLPLMYWAWLYV